MPGNLPSLSWMNASWMILQIQLPWLTTFTRHLTVISQKCGNHHTTIHILFSYLQHFVFSIHTEAHWYTYKFDYCTMSHKFQCTILLCTHSLCHIHAHKQHMLAKLTQRLISPWIIIPSRCPSYNLRTIVYQGMTVRTIHRSSALSPRIPCCTKQQSDECDLISMTSLRIWGQYARRIWKEGVKQLSREQRKGQKNVQNIT